MTILQRYILRLLLRNLVLSLGVFSILFLVFDFFDRIDNIVSEGGSFLLAVEYFALKLPHIVTLMMPVAVLVATLFTIGLLSRNSEITAMRASGITVFALAKPLLITGLVASITSMAINEGMVPYTSRRVKEIYNIDIRQKHLSGAYSQQNIWWRRGNSFYSVNIFDSRTNTFHLLSRFDIGDEFRVARRTDALRTRWVDELLGWNMEQVQEYRFGNDGSLVTRRYESLPLPINDRPESFYNVEAEPETMSYLELARFIKRQAADGISVNQYLPDLYEKISFPFVSVIIAFAVLPFALKPARTGSMAASISAGLVIGFSYYAVHSLSIAFGRAELWNPLVAAWTANILLGFVGLVLNLGAESPS